MADEGGMPPLGVTDVPVYPDVTTYANVMGNLHIWEGDGWKAESLAWKRSAYLASNLSGWNEVTYRGPQAKELLSRVSLNDVERWPIGSSKHLVNPDEHGRIANHGLAVRDGEDAYRQLASFPWPAAKNLELGLDVEIGFNRIFLYQVGGPLSLSVIERVTGQSQRDVEFLATKRVRVPGIDVDIELSRIGMAHTLAYELRGPFDAGPEVFDAVYRAGQDFDIQRLGWRTYMVNHTEGGFPQGMGSFLPAVVADPGAQSAPFFPPFLHGFVAGSSRLSGSVSRDDLGARFRTPHEVNWGWMAKFDHDFIGRAAIEAEAAVPRRKTVTLRWNKDDILDVIASQFEHGEEYRHFEFPTTPLGQAGGHADLVTKGGATVGTSSYAVYSAYGREMISQCAIDIAEGAIGNEVVVHWGEHGSRIKEIRATVGPYPYLDLPSNRGYDLSTVPSGVR